MTIASVGLLSQAASKAANQTGIGITAGINVAAGSLVLAIIGIDNNQTTDGDEGAVTGITDSVGGNTWTKAVEFCNGQGAAQAGTTVSCWYSRLVNGYTSGVSTVNASFSNAASRDASIIQSWVFTVGGAIQLEGTPATLATDAGDCSGSMNVTTIGVECLRVRAMSCETASGVAITATSGWTLIPAAASSGGADATNQGLRVEFRISTGSGDASNPTGGPTGVDWAKVYFAIRESASVAAGLLGQALL